MTWAIAVVLRPIVYFILLLLTGYLIALPIRRLMPDGKLKRLLLTDVSGDANARRWREFRARKKHLKDAVTRDT